MTQAVPPDHLRQRLEAYVRNCPEAAIDRQKCWNRLQANHTEVNAFNDLEDTTDVCGKCQVLLPCGLRVPGRQQ